MQIQYFEKSTNSHWGDHTLKFYIYENICDEREYKGLENTVYNLYSNSHASYLIHGTSMNVNNQRMHLISSDASKRYQEIPFDWSYSKHWYKQSRDNIKKFTDDQLLNYTDPKFYKFVKRMETFPPFNSEPQNWICYRMHINILDYTKFLSSHRDGGNYLYNKEPKDVRFFSCTYYLWDHKENEGGEFWTIDGHIYKPKKNTAIALNGHQVIHGVTQNMNPNKEPRLGFTTRWIHADDIVFENQSDRIIYSLPQSYD